MTRRKKIEIPLTLLELEDENYHILVECTFADNEYGKWVIDTGASKTVFDLTLNDKYIPVDDLLTEIESAGIGDTKIETRVGVIRTAQFGKLTIHDFQVGLIDLSHLNKLYKQYTNVKISGLIGSDFLVKYHAIIDYGKLIISLFY